MLSDLLNVYSEYVLGISDGVHEMGNIRWQLVGCLCLAWILVGICLAKGIKSSGKVSVGDFA